MIRWFYWVLLGVFIPMIALGQNLVPNHDFSDLNPDDVSFFCDSMDYPAISSGYPLTHWLEALNTSTGIIGVYHNCRYPKWDSPGIKWPKPYEGDGYIGLNLGESRTNTHIPDPFRISYCFVPLQQVLIKDSTYVVEVHVRPNLYWRNFRAVVNHFEVLFSQDTLNPPPHQYILGLQAQVDIHHWITDSAQWVKLSSSFVADGSERILNFGRFTGDYEGYPVDPADTIIGAGANVLVDAIYVYRARDTLFSVSLPNDTTICPDSPIHLEPLVEGFDLEDTITTFRWNTGSTDPTLLVSAPGMYWVEVTINKRWKNSDTIFIENFAGRPSWAYPDPHPEVCDSSGMKIELPHFADAKYYWNGKEGGREYNTLGLEPVVFKVVNKCWTLSDTIQPQWVNCEDPILPDAVTPDGDGLNDELKFAQLPQPFSIEVYDRWGTLRYRDEDYQNDWVPDVEPGVYLVLIHLKREGNLAERTLTTRLTVIR